MGILGSLTLGVVLAVDRGPLQRDHAGREPEPEPKEVRHNRVQFHRTMRLTTMEIDCHACDGDVGDEQRVSNNAEPIPAREAKGHEVNQGFQDKSFF